MTDTITRLRVGSKIFETMVDLDEALKIKKGTGDITSAWRDTNIYYEVKKGTIASNGDLQEAFQTTEPLQIVEKMIKKGEVELPKEFRDEEREAKKKRLIDWYLRNAIDSRSGRPFTPEVISSAIDQSGVNIDKRSIEQQIAEVTEKLKMILPMRIETKKISITVPAAQTGKVYGIINEYKEKEEWLSNGDLKVVVSIPVGLQSEFYDKLNSITHGSALTEEVKE